MSEWKVPVQSLIDHIKTAVDVDQWAKDMAEELLKEQEPVKPRYTSKSIYSWECGVCDEPFDRIANYCPNCGRKVQWE